MPNVRPGCMRSAMDDENGNEYQVVASISNQTVVQLLHLSDKRSQKSLKNFCGNKQGSGNPGNH